jgi:hypothetical protein
VEKNTSKSIGKNHWILEYIPKSPDIVKNTSISHPVGNDWAIFRTAHMESAVEGPESTCRRDLSMLGP